MTVSKAQQRATNKYKKSNYDRIELVVPKGNKDAIRSIAEAHGQSINAYISTAIEEKMKRDAGDSQEATGAPAVAEGLSLPQAQEAPPDGALVLVERGPVSVGRGDMRTMYTDQSTGREYYVEPVISDREWNDLQKAKATSEDDPDELSF